MENQAADLYAGLSLPPPKKRSADDAHISSSNLPDVSAAAVKDLPSETAAEPLTKKRKVASANDEIDVVSAVARLRTHMVVDKKFTKAATLFYTLMNEKLTAETSDLFLTALTEMIQIKGTNWSGKREFAQLIQLLLNKQELFSTSQQVMFPEWKLLAVTHYDLFTDDTFQFARAAKQIKLRLDAVVSSTIQPALKANQLALLMPIFRTLFSRHSVAWAKTSVESVLTVCTRHRLLFSEEQRVEVDQWTKAVQERRYASTITRNAASDARRNIVELTSENTSQAKAKVGRANHPLFNRDT